MTTIRQLSFAVGLALLNGGGEAPLCVAGATTSNGKAYQEPSSSYKPNLQNIEPINIEELMEREDLGNSGWFEPADFLRGKTTTVDQSENRELYNSYSAKYVEEGKQYKHNYLADPYVEYDMWDQAFRMLGGYIDCDPNEMVENNSHDSGGGGGGGGRRAASGDDRGDGCTRWIIWAAHVRGDGSDGDGSGNVNGNAQGDDRRGLEQEEWNEEQENEGEEGNEEEKEEQENKSNDNQMDTSDLDCHTRDTSWKLLGVYRQDYYQFLEQLTKHVWAYDSYEYNIMLATLEYTSTYCKQVGYHDGSPVYVDVMPIRGGYLHMGVYQDTSCIRPLSDKSVTYDDFYGNDYDGYERRRLSGDGDGEDYSYLMEYTLTEFNDIFETFRECTSCVDYPTYQDGYLIGDYGTDDESLINQCWKFHSHDSFACEADCLALATAQGTILNIKYGDFIFGNVAPNEERQGRSKTKRLNRRASLFVGTSIALFIFSFVSFAAARGNQYKMKKKIKLYRERLLNSEDNGIS